MRYGLLSGILWGLDTVILGIGLAMSPYIGSAEALVIASIVASFLHDAFCACWLFIYMAVKHRLGETCEGASDAFWCCRRCWCAAWWSHRHERLCDCDCKSRCCVHRNHLLPFIPLSARCFRSLILKERMGKGQLVALFVGLLGVMGIGAVEFRRFSGRQCAIGSFGGRDDGRGLGFRGSALRLGHEGRQRGQ